MINDFLLIYLSGGFFALAFLFVMYIRDRRRYLYWEKKDLIYKLSNRDTSAYEDWTKSLMKVRENDEKIELTCKQTLNLVIKDVPETWEELKKYVRSYISDIWVQDDFMQDRDLIIRENGTVELNDTQLMAGANITDMFLFICGVYGLKCNGIEEVRENEKLKNLLKECRDKISWYDKWTSGLEIESDEILTKIDEALK